MQRAGRSFLPVGKPCRSRRPQHGANCVARQSGIAGNRPDRCSVCGELGDLGTARIAASLHRLFEDLAEIGARFRRSIGFGFDATPQEPAEDSDHAANRCLRERIAAVRIWDTRDSVTLRTSAI